MSAARKRGERDGGGLERVDGVPGPLEQSLQGAEHAHIVVDDEQSHDGSHTGAGAAGTPDFPRVLLAADWAESSSVRQTLQQVLDDLGRRVAEIRRSRRLTQAAAAARAGMLAKDYQALEHGRRAITIRTAWWVANALEVPLRALFDVPQSRARRVRGRPRKS